MTIKIFEICNKFYIVMPFTFNRGDLYVVTTNGNLWSCTREECRAMWYKKAARQAICEHCSGKNIWNKHQLVVIPTVGMTVNWDNYSQKHDLCISEEGMYKLLVSTQHQKAKDARRHCCIVLFPYVWLQLLKIAARSSTIHHWDPRRASNCHHRSWQSNKSYSVWESSTADATRCLSDPTTKISVPDTWPYYQSTCTLCKLSRLWLFWLLRIYHPWRRWVLSIYLVYCKNTDGLFPQKDIGLKNNIHYIVSP